MARVRCSIPGAPEEISGVRFSPIDGELESEEIPDMEAARFASIPGYRLAPERTTSEPRIRRAGAARLP
jgi:hypothetical protein